jgi:peptide deformylase
MPKPLVTIPDTVLSTPSKTVTVFDKKLQTLVKEMKKTLLATKNPKGVGLAAPQIGEGVRVFLTKPTAKAAIRVFVNPEIIGYSETTTKQETDQTPLEGCLSIPLIWGHVNRAHTITLKYQDIDGVPHEELFEGFLATIIQHETDHTNGILFTQRVLEQHQKIYKTEKDENGKEYLEEIAI